MPKNKVQSYIKILLLSVTGLACGVLNIVGEAFSPTNTPGSEEGSYIAWYVALEGDNSNSCRDWGDPCETIFAAIGKAGEGDTIFISEGTFYPFDPGYGGLGIVANKSISLQGISPNRTFIDGNNERTVLLLTDGAVVSISDLTIQNAGPSLGSVGRGIDITFGSQLSLRRVVVRDNIALNEAGGILNNGTLNLFSVDILNNQAVPNPPGDSGSICGGIRNNGIMTVQNSEFSHNQANDLGGGLCNSESGTLEISDSTFFHNSSRRGGGLHNAGIAIVERTTFHENDQNAIFNAVSEFVLSLINVTVSNNVGAGIVNAANIQIRFSTIAYNDIGITGLSITESIITNSIIAGNIGENCFGFPSGVSELNMVNDDTCTRGAITTSATIYSGAPFLGVLQDNGGNTFTHALLPGSPAIDAVTRDCILEDQRREPRPNGDSCDMGAYEGIDFSVVEGAIIAITGTPDFISPTATNSIDIVIINKDTLCRKGPGLNYDVVSALDLGQSAELIGIGDLPDWYVINNPIYSDTPCWLPLDDINLPSVLPTLSIFKIPPTNTPIPTETPVTTPTQCLNC